MDVRRTLSAGDGITIVYRLHRVPEPRGVLVLLHGMASNMTRWTEFAEGTTLRETWDLLRIDLRGPGESLTRRAARGTPVALASRYASPRNDLRALPTAVYLQDLVEFVRPLPSLSRLRIPVLALPSVHASFTDPARTPRLLAEAPRCEVVVVESRHWMLTERPTDRWLAIGCGEASVRRPSP